MKKKYMIIIICIIAVLSALCVLGYMYINMNKTTILTIDEDAINIYYINGDVDSLVSSSYTLTTDTLDDQISEVLDALYTDTGETDKKVSIADDVVCEDYSITDSILYVNFSSEYSDMSSEREILCRAALVLSLTQLDGVDYVSVYVDDQPLVDSAGNIVGNMSASSFADILEDGNSITEEMTVTLYFTDETGTQLIPVTYTGEYTDQILVERYIVELLAEGPDNLDYELDYDSMGSGISSDTDDSIKVYETLDSDLVDIVSISTKDGICYVNFSSDFTEQNLDVSNDVVIYSIVNSLCSLSYVNQVQLIIAGESQTKFHDDISLNNPLERDLDLVIGYGTDTTE